MELSEKANSLGARMNQITEELSKNLNLSDELEEYGNEIVDEVQENTNDIQLYENLVPINEIIHLNNMVQDFAYARETLKENTDNARRVLNAIALKLLDEEDKKQANLIISFSELNKAVVENMKLYVKSYKEISNILLNIDKIKKENAKNPDLESGKTVNNNLIISTTDLIKQLSNSEE